MSNSCNVAEQREKEEKVLSSFLVLSFVGSAIVHIVVLTFSSLWFKTPKLVEKPIEVILVEPSTPKAVKIKQNPLPKDKPVAVKHTTPKFKTITKSLNTSRADVQARANGTPSTLLSHPEPSIPIVKQSAIARKHSQPVKTARQPKSVVALKPKPNLSPLDPIPPLPTPVPVVSQTLPPLPTLKPSQTLPPFPTVAQKPPLPTSAPTQKPLLKPTSTPELKSFTTLSSNPTQTKTPKLPFPTSLSTTKDNSTDNRITSHSNIATTLGNRNRGGNGTHDSEQSGNSGNESLPGSGKTKETTGNRNERGNGLVYDGLACRRCPPPNYPSGSEGIEARVVVAIDVRRDGSIIDAHTVEPSGHDNLDQEVEQTVKKKWKFVSTDSEQHIRAAVDFAKPGSEYERQARERVRHAHELQQQKRRERLNTENPAVPDIIYTPRP